MLGSNPTPLDLHWTVTRMRACFLLVLYKATYGSETLFDMFWTRRTNKFGIFKSEGRTKKSETRYFKTGHLSALSVKKEAPGSKNERYTHYLLPWDFTVTREPPLPEAFSRFSPLFMGPVTGGDWASIPSQIFRDSFVSNIGRRKGSKGENIGEQKGQAYMLFLIPVSIWCQGRWQIGNQSLVFIATWYPSLAIYALTEVRCGQPNKPRWDCRDMRQGKHVPALEGLFILHVKL